MMMMTLSSSESHSTKETFLREDFLISFVVHVEFDIDKYCMHSIIRNNRLGIKKLYEERDFLMVIRIVHKEYRPFFSCRLACLLIRED